MVFHRSHPFHMVRKFHSYFHRKVNLSLWAVFHILFTWYFTSQPVKYYVRTWSPFHRYFTWLFHISFHISVKLYVKTCVKTLWNPCETFTCFSHELHCGVVEVSKGPFYQFMNLRFKILSLLIWASVPVSKAFNSN